MYKIQEILNWFEQFEKYNIQIKGETIEFNVTLNKYSVPHLLGLHYMNTEKKNGFILLNFIRENNLSDEIILDEIAKNNSDKLKSVKTRIETFKNFLENLENGIIVEKTNKKTNIKSNFLIVQLENKLTLHLGICKTEVEDCLEVFGVKPQENAYFETYIGQHGNKYYKKSKIFEKIDHIYKYNEKNHKFENFTFKEKDILDKIVISYKNGNLQEVVHLKNSQLSGTFTSYYENGQLKVHGEYSNDLPEGQWKTYNINGKIMSIATYKNGSLIDFITFGDNGSNGIIGEIMYKPTEVKIIESELTIPPKNELTISPKNKLAIPKKNKLTIFKKNKLIIPKKNKNKEENEK
ncbi:MULTISPECIES: PBECR4 domain-containing protein [unclassified Fusobacterium]|uniref:PBECR4 domain-containing protein n=1 Tax=unclassified Fusobacterium TaxID=2648384 RepID=UPI001B8AC8C5|nr:MULTISPECIES: PBECR4 domain-containing protein [unclassified Fusobacterium]MBR8700475.1 hypothetical protein [Fusobacterium sp. DD45]MBR8710260.1 hypothetical protein [Fusobacterium sp. DD28]MBR8750782.1 hypothetical protein [Fusobacterium sp. DD26]